MTRSVEVPGVIVVTGTDTGVGKTVVTAAFAALLGHAGRSVAAYKPAQTGVAPGEPGDMAEVARLAGVTTEEGVRLRAPMAPRPAAAMEGTTLPALGHHLDTITRLRLAHDHVLVEGAGGLLVELTEVRETLADLASAVPDVGVVVTVRSALGTLNHTMLTREALQHRHIRLLGLVIGSWPDHPDVIDVSNRDEFAAGPEGLLGTIPEGAPLRSPDDFTRTAGKWLPAVALRLEPATVSGAAHPDA